MAEITPNLQLRALDRTELPHPFNTFTISKLEKAGVPRIQTLSTNTAPPPNPPTQAAYYVTTGQTGTLWEGFEEVVALWSGASWVPIPLQTGSYAWIIDEATAKTYIAGQGWVEFSERVSLNKQFSKIYGYDSVNGQFDASTLGPRKSSILNGSDTVYTFDFLSAPTRLSNIPLTPNSSILDQRGPVYPLYRYTGTENLTGYSGSRMPVIASGRVTIYGSTDNLRATPPIDIFLAGADGTPSLTLNRVAPLTYLETESNDEEVGNSASDPGTPLVTLTGVSEASTPASTGWIYEQEFSPLILDDSPGYVCLRFRSGTNEWLDGDSHTAGDPYPVLLQVELVVSSAF